MPHAPRYFANDPQTLERADPHKVLLKTLTIIVTQCSPQTGPPWGWDYSGLYSGPTSTAYLFYRLSLTHPGLQLKGRTMHDWCGAYLDGPRRRHPDGVGKLDPSHCGIAQEVFAHTAVTSVAKHDLDAVAQLCSYADTLLGSGGSDEWLYGRAGYLYFLRLVKDGFRQEQRVQERIQEVIERVIDRILQSPRPWTWHKEAYLGAAHGAMGIITQIILSSPSRANMLESTLGELLDTQYPSGNLPPSIPVSNDDQLVQFCHGAPGFIISLTSLRTYFQDLRGRIDTAITRGRECIWERGLLTKEPCLCHGIAGNALAFDDLEKFEHYLYFMTEEQLRKRWHVGSSGVDVSADSLFTSDAGRAWAWVVADKILPKRCIGYNDL